jgi:[acyl-carrier-protein] S-malonyltransferase
MASKVILCPGQGAQVVGMGKAWRDHAPEARAVFDEADRIVGHRFGATLSSLCFEGPGERLNQTDVSQPAIFTTSIACWRALSAGWGSGNASGVTDANVVATGGLSLGEYTALCIAGAFSFEDGLKLVMLRGAAMQDAADAIKQPDGSPGSGMVALIGADEPQAVEVCQRARGSEVLVPANFNAPGQVVISGAIAACQRALAAASELGLRATALQVAGAFHSPLMQPAADRLAAALDKTPIAEPRCAVACNVTGALYEPAGGGTGGQDFARSIRSRLVEQLTSPVRWSENARLLAERFGSAGGAEAHELAPGKTLSGLMRRIDKTLKVEPHDEPTAS